VVPSMEGLVSGSKPCEWRPALPYRWPMRWPQRRPMRWTGAAILIGLHSSIHPGPAVCRHNAPSVLLGSRRAARHQNMPRKAAPYRRICGRLRRPTRACPNETLMAPVWHGWIGGPAYPMWPDHARYGRPTTARLRQTDNGSSNADAEPMMLDDRNTKHVASVPYRVGRCPKELT
jgi:hypothetical protein